MHFLCIAAIPTHAQDGNINKVLIIGIDGCRPDALLAAETPNMDKLRKSGAYTFKARTDEISSSGGGLSEKKTAILAALDIASEYFQLLKDRDDLVADIRKRSEKMVYSIESLLS